VIPREPFSAEQQAPAKAAVVVKLRGGKLTAAQAAGIRNLVASAVDQLPPERVSVMTASGIDPLSILSDGRTDYQDRGLAGELENKLLATLSPVAGQDRLRVSVLVENSTASSERTQESYDPARAVLLTSQESMEQRRPALPSAARAEHANTSEANASEFIDSQTARAPDVARNATRSYAVSRTVDHVSQPAGSVRRIATAVLVDDPLQVENSNTTRRKRSPQEMEQIMLLAKAAVGFDASRGDQLAVQNITFVTEQVGTLPTSAPVKQAFAFTQKWRGAVRYAVLLSLFLLTYLFVFRPIKKQLVKMLQTVPLELRPGAPRREELGAAAGAVTSLTSGASVSAAAALDAASVQVSQDEVISKQLKQILVERVTKEPFCSQPFNTELDPPRRCGQMKTLQSSNTGLRKAAILLVLLGEEISSRVYAALPPVELQRLTQEIADLGYISKEVAGAVLKEFNQLSVTQEYLAQGGPDYAHKLLVKAFGEDEAEKILEQVTLAQEESAANLRISAKGRSGAARQIYTGRASPNYRRGAGASWPQSSLAPDGTAARSHARHGHEPARGNAAVLAGIRQHHLSGAAQKSRRARAAKPPLLRWCQGSRGTAEHD
jgi:hypothetical protein